MIKMSGFCLRHSNRRVSAKKQLLLTKCLLPRRKSTKFQVLFKLTEKRQASASMNFLKRLPHPRTSNIVVQSLNTEILIYDLNVHKAFNLNETFAGKRLIN
jgi:hypothetical protein